MESASEELERRSRYLSNLILIQHQHQHHKNKQQQYSDRRRRPPPLFNNNNSSSGNEKKKIKDVEEEKDVRMRMRVMSIDPPQNQDGSCSYHKEKIQEEEIGGGINSERDDNASKKKITVMEKNEKTKKKKKDGVIMNGDYHTNDDDHNKKSSSTCNNNLNELKIRASDMPPEWQKGAFRCAREALSYSNHCHRHPHPHHPKLDCKHLALTLKKEFDSLYGPAWHCIVGTSFGSYVTHSLGGFLYFSIDKVYILLFRTAVEPLDQR